ncbi:MAG: hypothetical protein HY348_11610 [Nitrospira defluvii]|nr:hypothetical protein [Nitrospira defluvii]
MSGRREAREPTSVQLGFFAIGLVTAEPSDVAPIGASRWCAIPLGTQIYRMFCSARVGHLWPRELIVDSCSLLLSADHPVRRLPALCPPCSMPIAPGYL